MTITIDLSPEVEERLRQLALASGKTMEQVAVDIIMAAIERWEKEDAERARAEAGNQ